MPENDRSNRYDKETIYSEIQDKNGFGVIFRGTKSMRNSTEERHLTKPTANWKIEFFENAVKAFPDGKQEK